MCLDVFPVFIIDISRSFFLSFSLCFSIKRQNVEKMQTDYGDNDNAIKYEPAAKR